ncbi:unnamed protein product [Paramecium octaurelia]|uniref:Uncharacterized protein n=1 Tax=Paramecium octaurelia TaxID=43137 RepID=A0A8S1Y5L0_PAROT|nr:unnamed protein product [Paramecium octaurelia]
MDLSQSFDKQSIIRTGQLEFQVEKNENGMLFQISFEDIIERKFTICCPDIYIIASSISDNNNSSSRRQKDKIGQKQSLLRSGISATQVDFPQNI